MAALDHVSRPTVPGPIAPGNPVRFDQRGPLGGVANLGSVTSGVVALNAATHSAGRVTATGNIEIGAPSGGADGQTYMVDVVASGGDRAVAVAAEIFLTTGLTRTITVPSGRPGYLLLWRDGVDWVLLGQTVRLA